MRTSTFIFRADDRPTLKHLVFQLQQVRRNSSNDYSGGNNAHSISSSVFIARYTKMIQSKLKKTENLDAVDNILSMAYNHLIH